MTGGAAPHDGSSSSAVAAPTSAAPRHRLSSSLCSICHSSVESVAVVSWAHIAAALVSCSCRVASLLAVDAGEVDGRLDPRRSCVHLCASNRIASHPCLIVAFPNCASQQQSTAAHSSRTDLQPAGEDRLAPSPANRHSWSPLQQRQRETGPTDGRVVRALAHTFLSPTSTEIEPAVNR